MYPSKTMFSERYHKHYICGIMNDNTMISTVFRSALFNLSRMGNNIRKICFENELDTCMWDLYNVTGIGVANDIVNRWKRTVVNENIRVAEQIKELVFERDNLQEWLLERGDICDIISFLCTM